MLRAANYHDISRMVALGEAMHGESRFDAIGWDSQKVADLIAGLISSDDGLALVAEQGCEIVGGFLGFIDTHWCSNDRVASDLALYVTPAHRGGTTGLRLLRAYATWATDRGAKMVTCGITTGVALDASTRLFQIAGFAHVGHLFALGEPQR